MNIQKGLKKVQRTLSKKSPELLAAIGISGYFTAIVLAVTETPKALQLIDEERDDNGYISKKDAVKASWKCYIPSAATAVGATISMVASVSISNKRNAALATAYATALTAAREYKETVKEVVGEEKEKEVNDKIAEKRIKENPVTKNDVLLPKEGDTLFYDPYSGRYFRSTVNEIKGILADLSYAMLNHDVVNLNDLYDMIGLDRTLVGRDYGWEINHVGTISPMFSTQLADNNQPCIVLGFNYEPMFNVF